MNQLTGIRWSIAALVAAGVSMGQNVEMRQVAIVDPVLQMTAWTLNAPGNWQVEGTMLPGSSCNSGTSPVFRAFAPDGRTGVYFLPRMDWAWGPGIRASNDCLPSNQVISAKDFLTNLLRIRQLGFVREEAVPELAELRRNNENMNRPGFQIQADMARYLVRYDLKGQSIDEWLTATVSCTETQVMAVGRQHSCSAFVSRWFAPSSQLQASIPMFQAMKMTLNQQWMSRWTATMVQHLTRLYQSQTEALLQQGRLAQAARMKQHEDFMASMQQSQASRNDQFRQSQYQKQRNKEDYVDYILDCQRLSNGEVNLAIGNCPNRETR